jgi:hypothetical protein
MIQLRLIREPSQGGATLGSLYLNDVWQCWTLEDQLREPRQTRVRPAMDPGDAARWVMSWKQPGQTAIPAGLYRVKLTMSTRFGVVLPEVFDVPGFSGIRIHAGNTPADTEGCLLVGHTRGERQVLESRLALQWLLQRFRAAGDTAFIHVENPPGWHLTPAPAANTRSV